MESESEEKGNGKPVKRKFAVSGVGMSRRQHPVLLSLQASDCVAASLSRVGGPRGPRSSLADRHGGGEISDDVAAAALVHLEAVAGIRDPRVRRVVALASQTGAGCQPVHVERSIAKATGWPRATVGRLLRRGIAEVADRLAVVEEKIAA